MARKRTLRSKTGGGQFKKSYDAMTNQKYPQALRDDAKSAVQQLLGTPKYPAKNAQEFFDMDSREGEPRFASLDEATKAWELVKPKYGREYSDLLGTEYADSLGRQSEAARQERLAAKEEALRAALAGQAAAATGRAADCEEELAAARASVEALQQQILGEQEQFLKALQTAKDAEAAVEEARSEQQSHTARISALEQELLGFRALKDKSGEFEATLAGLTAEKQSALAELEKLKGTPELKEQLAEQLQKVAQLTVSEANLRSLTEEQALDNTVIQGELEAVRAYAKELIDRNESLTGQVGNRELQAALDTVTAAMGKKHESLESEIAGLMALLETERSKKSLSSAELQQFTQRHAAALAEAKEAGETLQRVQRIYQETLDLNRPILEKYPKVLAEYKSYKAAFEEAQAGILKIVETIRELSKRVDVDIDFLFSQQLPQDESNLSIYKNLMFHDALNTAYYVKKAFLIGMNANTTDVDEKIQENMKELLVFKEKFQAKTKECDSLFDGLIELEGRFGLLKQQYEQLKGEFIPGIEQLNRLLARAEELQQRFVTVPSLEMVEEFTAFKAETIPEFERSEIVLRTLSEKKVNLGTELQAREVALSKTESDESKSKLQRLREKLAEDLKYYQQVAGEDFETRFFGIKNAFLETLRIIELFITQNQAKKAELSAVQLEKTTRLAEVSTLQAALEGLQAQHKATQAAAAAAAAREQGAAGAAAAASADVAQTRAELEQRNLELARLQEQLQRKDVEVDEARASGDPRRVQQLEAALLQQQQQLQGAAQVVQQIDGQNRLAEQSVLGALGDQKVAIEVNERLQAQMRGEQEELQRARALIGGFEARLLEARTQATAEAQAQEAEVAKRLGQLLGEQKKQLEAQQEAALAQQRGADLAENLAATKRLRGQHERALETLRGQHRAALEAKDLEFRQLQVFYEQITGRIDQIRNELQTVFEINVRFLETDTPFQRLNKLIAAISRSLGILKALQEPEVFVYSKPPGTIAEGQTVNVVVMPRDSRATSFIVIFAYADGFIDSLVVQTIDGTRKADYVIKRAGNYNVSVFAL